VPTAKATKSKTRSYRITSLPADAGSRERAVALVRDSVRHVGVTYDLAELIDELGFHKDVADLTLVLAVK